MSEFGTMLRRARETRGLTLRDIEARTKISIGALEALERGDASRLPGGIFARSYVRAYAAEVGLDPEATLREFVARFDLEPASPEPAADSGSRFSRPLGMPVVVTVLVAGLLFVALVLALTLAKQPEGQSKTPSPYERDNRPGTSASAQS